MSASPEMSKEKERPKCDNSAGKVPNIVEVPQAEEGDQLKNEEVRDTHTCGLCQLVFDDLEVYIKHKLFEDNCKVKYTKSQTNRRVLIPQLIKVKKETEDTPRRDVAPGVDCSEENNENQLGSGLSKKTARYVHKRWKLHHSESNIIERPSYKCDQCPKTFTREAALKRHVEFDHGKPLFSDEEEDNEEEEEEAEEAEEVAASTRKTIAVRGVGRGGRAPRGDPANEIRPYACQECGYKFKEASVLRAHMLTHGDVRDFPCTWEGCAYAFKTKGSLIRHMRRHTGERPFKCDLCHRAFGESGALTRHLKSRTSCKNKTDNDLPRYGKRVEFATIPNMPQVSLGTCEELQQNQDILELQNGENGQNVDLSSFPNLTKVTLTTRGDLQDNEGILELRNGDQGLTTSVTLLTVPEVIVQQEGVETDETEPAVYQIEDIEEECSNVAAEVDHIDDPDQSSALQVNLEGQPYEPNQCRVCLVVLEDQENLREHLKTHLADVPFRCGLCAYATSKREELDLHRQVVHHTGAKDNQIEQSQKDVAALVVEGETVEIDDSAVQEELSNEHSQLNQAPSDCGVVAAPLSDSPESPPPEPEISSKQASIALSQLLELQNSSERRVKVHSSIHGYRVLHKCPVCNRSFRGYSYLKLHMRSHTGERPHSCTVCSKTFSTKDTLSKHMHCHTEERQYQCGECGKLFKRISHVREHLKIHSNERPFHCSLCDKAFKTANACKVHLRTHTDFLPYKCPKCRRQFREKGSLERHLRTHTGEKPFNCKHCGRHFAEHGTLNRHIRAKVPCTRQLAQLREQETVGQVAQVTELTEGGEEVTQVTEVAAEDLPTVLAEFSSVVADTQQYIMEPQQQDPDNQVLTEFVMVTADGETQQVQNIEVLTEEQLAGRHPEQLQEYVLLKSEDHPHITVAMVNPEDGKMETMEMFTDDLQTAEQPLTIVGDTIQSIAMVPESNEEQAELGDLDPSVHHIASVDIDPNSEQIGVVAMTTEAEDAITTGEEEFHTVTVIPEDEDMETVEMETSEEHIILEPTEDQGDTVQQAMFVANVVEETVHEELH